MYLYALSNSTFSSEQIVARIRGEFYSTHISFNNADEVEKAFEELDGQMTKVHMRT